MAMATVQATLVPLEEYLQTTYHPDRDWVDGETRERNMGDVPHALIQKWLAMYFGVREEAWGVLALTEARVQTSATHYRIPDVCVMGADWRFERIVQTPPLLCVEILSPDDRMTEMLEKVEEYLRMGVTAIWVVDPRRKKTFCTDARGTLEAVLDELVVAGTDIRLDVRSLFTQLNKLEGRG